MMNKVPLIKEKPDAIDFNFKRGEIELRDVSFKHLITKPEDSKN